MSQYRFELAGSEDDADLRHILAATPMEGSMVVSFRREPSFFDAAVVEGRFQQVVAARHVSSGRIVGFGSRSITERYVNGVPTRVGYLSSLRLLEEHRNLGLVARGYRYFRQLHGDRQTELYLTTIADKNQIALKLLTSGRAGLPRYHPAGIFHTVAIPLPNQRSRRATASGLTLRAAGPGDCGLIVEFLQSEGPRRQFFPCYTQDDLLADGGLLHGLSPANLTLAFRGPRLVGMAGWWDQRAFRQTVIERYRGLLGWLRSPYNALAPLAHWPCLADPGEPLHDVYLALPLVAEDDKQVFAELMAAVTRLVSDVSVDYLLVGMHESDPLLAVVRAFRGIWYNTRLFLVTWDPGLSLIDSLDGRPHYLELGAL
jgi:hypothetical protein